MGLVVKVAIFVLTTTEALGVVRRSLAPTMRMSSSDTGGADVLFEDVSIRRGPVELLSGVTWKVMPRERWGVAGENGVGKSTLLKVASGELPSASGRALLRRGARLGYLEQTAVSGSNASVFEEVVSRMPEVHRARERLAKKEDGAEDDLEFALTGHETEAKAAKVLRGLGFRQDQFRARCDELSGGWQMRVALARLLLSEPEICFLDEPSNHLDGAARTWLASTLADFGGTLILVSHDVTLLSAACDNIAEVVGEAGRASLELYKGFRYDEYLSERSARAKRWVATYERQVVKAKELEAFVDRFGAKASKAAQAKDRAKKLEKLRNEMPSPPPKSVRDLAAAFNEEDESDGGVLGPSSSKTRFELPAAPKCGEIPVAFSNAAVGYYSSENDAALATTIVRNATFEIPRGARVAVRGPNGVGKSTLGKAIAGVLPLLSGSRVADERLKVGYFTQDLSQELDPAMTALEVATKGTTDRPESEVPSPTKARSVLGALGLGQDAALRKVGSLSGGQKARAALASFALAPGCNLYVFDEPSNHMSLDACEALLGALKNYDGTLVVISHDKTFLSRLDPTHVLTVAEGTAYLEDRGLQDHDWRTLSHAEGKKKKKKHRGKGQTTPTSDDDGGHRGGS
mmetsp:Transcript_16434/g.53508  ORF Transcript_16434/g.53508 Transcript_16434/m.53508 type:complete len:632 (-) Transcript_16434:324-2219(-)